MFRSNTLRAAMALAFCVPAAGIAQAQVADPAKTFSREPEFVSPQLRESTIHPDTRRLVQLTLEDAGVTRSLMDMLLAKKRAADRRNWLETKGDLASLEV